MAGGPRRAGEAAIQVAGASATDWIVASADLRPSSGLRRAATSERDRIRRARERLVERKQQLEAHLAQVVDEIAALDARDRLLAELTTPAPARPATAASQIIDAATPEDVPAAHEHDGAPPAPANVLRGRQLREAATRVLYLTHGPDHEVHYRAWLTEVLRAGIDVVGSDPAAAFLTNVARSPIVVRGEEPGTYRIDSTAAADLHRQLAEAEAELVDVVNVIARDANADESLRDHRTRLTATVRRLEGQVAEAGRVMAPATAERTEDEPDAGTGDEITVRRLRTHAA